MDIRSIWASAAICVALQAQAPPPGDIVDRFIATSTVEALVPSALEAALHRTARNPSVLACGMKAMVDARPAIEAWARRATRSHFTASGNPQYPVVLVDILSTEEGRQYLAALRAFIREMRDAASPAAAKARLQSTLATLPPETALLAEALTQIIGSVANAGNLEAEPGLAEFKKRMDACDGR